MKKSIIALTGATIVLSAFLGGCACTGNKALSFEFSEEFNSTETLTYTVQYSDNYLSYEKDDSIDFDLNYQDGTYVSTCEKLVDRTKIESDIKDALDDQDIYELSTDFNIVLRFTVGGKEYTHAEKMTSKTYIASSKMSLAPLYSEEEAEYVMFSADGDAVQAAIVTTESKTLYNKDNYIKTKRFKSFNLDDEIDFTDATETEFIGKYDFRTVIDNSELYFAIRGLTAVSEKSYVEIPVFSPTFNNAETLKFTNNGRSREKFKIKYNGEEKEYDISYVNFSFQLSNVNTSGKPQYVSIQTEKADNLKNFNMPVKFAKPLFLYNGYKSLGALTFTISEIER